MLVGMASVDETGEATAFCERCGSPLPEGARFCPHCGAPVAVVTTEERKVVTVMFADLVGSTGLAARLDPERFREVMSEFFRMVSFELESLRGRAEKFIGDAVMAVFGLPQTHDDDALRAVRAGLIIRDRVARLGPALGLAVPLRVHVGINTGPVATGRGPTDQLLVSGAAVNMAARLQQLAAPEEILVGATTWQLTREAVEYGPPRTVPAGGFADEVQAWPVVALSSRSSRRTIPLIDRRSELALLTSTFERVRETSRCHLVTLVGEPGIGKSRLVDEFLAGLPEEAKVLFGRANQFEEDVAFAPLAEMLRREIGADPETPPDELRARLQKLAEGCCEPSDVERVAASLGLALGLGAETARASREEFWSTVLGKLQARLGREEGQGRPYRASEIRSGLLALLQSYAEAGPVVMVFENLHLAQSGLLDLIEGVISRSRRLPLMVLCVARDHLLEGRPGWGGGLGDAVTLRLDPLPLAAARELVLAAGEAIDEETADRIAVQTGGNPFFIVETTGMLLQEHPEHAQGAPHAHLLPPTVQAVVASRLDHLPEDARELARKASVFARASFDVFELSLIAEPDQRLLKELEDEEVLVREEGTPGAWRFRHELLRDVAYETLSKRDRERLHVQVADGLEREAPGRFPQAVANHLERAARAALDLDPQDRRLAERAVNALIEAGDHARRRIESGTAIELYERALALAGPQERWGEREAHILSFMGESFYWLGESRDATSSLTRALKVSRDVWTRAHASRFLGELALNYGGDPEGAAILFDDALAAAREAGEPFTLARTLLMAGWSPYGRGDLEAAEAMFREALEISRSNAEGDAWAEARALTSLASVVSPVDDEERCLVLSREALDVGTKLGDPFTIAVAQEYMGNSLRRMLRLDEARPFIEEALRTFRDLDARWEVASALGDRADINRLAGNLDQAAADFRESLELCKRLRERSLIVWTSTQLIRVLVAQGELAEARRILEDPSSWVDQTDAAMAASRFLAESVVALAEGDRELALSRSRLALEAERDEGSPNPVASRVWWHGRVFGPDAVGGEARLEEARTRLEKAHWFAALKEPDLVVTGARAGSS
jgi:class 3 adenylate cyclase/tetratricopeptide (TPR) repeat protein